MRAISVASGALTTCSRSSASCTLRTLSGIWLITCTCPDYRPRRPPRGLAGQDRKHRGIWAFAISMHQAETRQRPLKMTNGITRRFGEVTSDGARAGAVDMFGDLATGGGSR
jgi:hypothetical protein